MSTTRRLGGGSTPQQPAAPANSYQPTGTAPRLASQQGYGPAAATPPPAPARQQAPAAPGMRVPAFARGAALPPADPSVDTSRVGEDRQGFEKRDDTYWKAHPFAAGTYDLDVHCNKIVDWSVGRLTIGLQVTQWDRNDGPKGAPGPHHQRPIDWDHTRPDLLAKIANADHAPEEGCDCPGCKGHRGLQYWRAEMIKAYLAAGYPEDTWPKSQDGHPMIPWWALLFHQCNDGVFVPVVLRATIAVQAGRQNWPTIRAIKRIVTEDGKPFQAPMPYAVPPYLAEDMRWSVAEVKRWGTPDGFNGTAEMAILDRNGVALGHAGLPTYKDL